MRDLREGVDLRQRAADPERLAEQGCGEASGVFLVTLVERLRDGVAQLAQAVADRVAPVMDEVVVHEHRLRPGFLELRPFGELHRRLRRSVARRRGHR